MLLVGSKKSVLPKKQDATRKQREAQRVYEQTVQPSNRVLKLSKGLS